MNIAFRGPRGRRWILAIPIIPLLVAICRVVYEDGFVAETTSTIAGCLTAAMVGVVIAWFRNDRPGLLLAVACFLMLQVVEQIDSPLHASGALHRDLIRIGMMGLMFAVFGIGEPKQESPQQDGIKGS